MFSSIGVGWVYLVICVFVVGLVSSFRKVLFGMVLMVLKLWGWLLMMIVKCLGLVGLKVCSI